MTYGYFVAYDAATGAITRLSSFYGEPRAYALPQETDLLEVPAPFDLDAHYVSGGCVVPRPRLPEFDRLTIAADGVDEAMLTGLPVPCVVTIDGQPHTVTDGAVAISSDAPAVVVVEIDHWPYQPLSVEITAQ